MFYTPCTTTCRNLIAEQLQRLVLFLSSSQHRLSELITALSSRRSNLHRSRLHFIGFGTHRLARNPKSGQQSTTHGLADTSDLTARAGWGGAPALHPSVVSSHRNSDDVGVAATSANIAVVKLTVGSDLICHILG